VATLSETDKRPAAITGRLRALSAVPDLQYSWIELEKDSNCTFFQSWYWMGTWLDSFADRQNMLVFECFRDNALIALGVLGRGKVRRRWFVTSQQLVLNESADESRNMLVEHNELLVRNGEMANVIPELFRVLERVDGWEEFKVAFGKCESWFDPSISKGSLVSIIDWAQPSWLVPLAPETTVESLLRGLSANRRYQMRRAIREFSRQGPLSITAAGDVAEAHFYFLALGELHTKRWRVKGKDGCFSRAEWVRFHEQLISKGFAAGIVQLLRIRCGDQDIGYIYNLLWRGNVLMLQTGFLHSSNNLLRSGYVSHLLAMELNARQGMRGYDFMPGNDEYKRVLARRGTAVASLRFQRRSLKFGLERAVVDTVRRFRGVLGHVRSIKSYLEAFACLIMLPDGASELASQIETFASLIPV
jgi:hypothetical protein